MFFAKSGLALALISFAVFTFFKGGKSINLFSLLWVAQN
jgi:hypothetical protein